MTARTLQPPAWARPSGYSNGIATRGTLLFVAGQIGWDEKHHMVPGDLVTQSRQALLNIVAVLAEGGARADHIVRLTWYVTDAQQYRSASSALGVAYREVMGKHYPTMTAVQVSALIEPDAVVEIEATAVLPD